MRVLERAGRLNIVQTQAELERLVPWVQVPPGQQVGGIYDRSTGRIYIVADTTSGEYGALADAVFGHETTHHSEVYADGILQGVLGTQFAPLYKKLTDLHSQGDPAALTAFERAVASGNTDSERLAYFVEGAFERMALAKGR